MAERRSVCAFRWKSGKLGYAMKKHFLAWMEVAIISFLGLRSPLPRIVILPVHARLGLFALSLLLRLNKKAHADFAPLQPGDCRRALNYLLLRFGSVRFGSVCMSSSATRQSR